MPPVSRPQMPFVGEMFDPRTRLGDYARRSGRDTADAIRHQGALSAQLWSGIGQNVSGTLRDIAAYPDQQRARARQETLMQREEQAYQDGEQAKQADAAKAQRLQDLVKEHGGRVPSERLLQEFGPEDAADISKAFDAVFPKVEPPKPQQIKTRNADGSESIQFVEGKIGESFTSAAEPPKPEKLTFGAPTPAMVGGRRVFVRTGSDGKTYDMRGGVLDGDPTPIPPQSATSTPAPVSLQTREVVDEKGQRVMANFNPKTGQWSRPDGSVIANPQPSSGTSKPATGLEKRALNFFNRAQQADADLESMEPDVQQMGLGGQTYMQYAPNFMQSDVGQRYTQAQRAFTEARLRKDSGAAIPAQEFENDRQTYFAQPGDSPATLEQKRRARGAILASLGFESGQALGEFVGDRDEARQIVEGYKRRSSVAPTSEVVTTVPDLTGLKDGFRAKFPTGHPFAGQEWILVNGAPKRVK